MSLVSALLNTAKTAEDAAAQAVAATLRDADDAPECYIFA